MRDGHVTIRPQILLAYLLLAAVILVIVAGAVIGSRRYVAANTIVAGDPHSESQTMELDGVSSLEAQIILAFGTMTLSGGAEQLLEVDSVSNIPDMRPDLSYEISGGEAILRMQPIVPAGLPNVRNMDQYQNEWEVRLHNATPADLTIEMGMGSGNLDFRGLTLTNLIVEAGNGAATIDLRGEWTRGFDAYFDGGSGKVTVLLPDDVPVNVTVEQGIGRFSQSGLTENGELYTNGVAGAPGAAINIEMEVGLGDVHMEVRDEELAQ